MHLKEGVICICFPVQQRLKLFGGGGFYQGFNRGFGIFDDVLVVFHFAQFVLGDRGEIGSEESGG